MESCTLTELKEIETTLRWKGENDDRHNFVIQELNRKSRKDNKKDQEGSRKGEINLNIN